MVDRVNTVLRKDHKSFLVQRLAVYDSPREAAEALKAEFDLEISPQRAEAYDPGKRAGARLSRPLRELFQATRKRFLEELGDLPSANKAVRVRRLERMSIAAEQRGNFVLAAALLKQIAEEVGGVFTNRRELTGRDGKPMQVQNVDDMTDDELEERAQALMAKARGIANHDSGVSVGKSS